MSILDIILIGIALAMDCFAVSTAQGLSSGGFRPKSLLMATMFGLFQGGMPLIGYYAGSVWSQFFSQYAPWIALILLLYLGGKMIWESLHESEEKSQAADWSLWNLTGLALATSIDALATGVIFIPCPERVWIGVSIIALCSFLFAMAGYMIGVFVGKRFRLNVELLGGIILIAIGIKIWAQGIFF